VERWVVYDARNVLQITVNQDQVVHDAANSRISLFIVIEVFEVQKTIGGHCLDRMVQTLNRDVGKQLSPHAKHTQNGHLSVLCIRPDVLQEGEHLRFVEVDADDYHAELLTM